MEVGRGAMNALPLKLNHVRGKKSDAVTGEWRKLQNEELYALRLTRYYSGDKTNKTEICTTCSTYGGDERCIHCFGGET